MKPAQAASFFCTAATTAILIAVTAVTYGDASLHDWIQLENAEGRENLHDIAMQIKHNHGQIHTWQGAFTLTEQSYFYDAHANAARSSFNVPGTGPLIRRANGNLTFAYAQQLDAGYSELALTGAPAFYDATESPLASRSIILGLHRRNVITPDHYLHFEPNIRYGATAASLGYGSSGRAALREPATKAANQHWGDAFDPRKILYFSHQPVWGLIRHFLHNHDQLIADGLPSYSLEIHQNKVTGDHKMTLKMPYDSNQTIIHEMLMSHDSGNNVTSSTIRVNDRTIEERGWTYGNYDGIYVPRNAWKINFDSEGREIFRRMLELEHMEVNISIDPDQFTWKALGLEPGDRYIDLIENKTYVLTEEGTLGPPHVDEIMDTTSVRGLKSDRTIEQSIEGLQENNEANLHIAKDAANTTQTWRVTVIAIGVGLCLLTMFAIRRTTLYR